MSASHLTPTAVDLLCTLGRQAEKGVLTPLLEALNRLHERSDSHPQLAAFFRISESFSLDPAEQVLLANGVWRTVVGRAFAQPAWMAHVRRVLAPQNAQQELSFLLSPSPGTLLRHACALLLGRTAAFPPFLHLAAGGAPLFHGAALLDELDAFWERCVQQEALLPAVLGLSGEQGGGRRFLLTELARRRGCLLLQVDARAAPEEAPLIAGFALLYDAMIALTDYTDAACELCDALSGWFSVLFVTTEEGVCHPGARCRAFFTRAVGCLTREERLEALRLLFPQCSEGERLRAAGTYRLSPGTLVNAATRMRAEDSAGGLMRLLQEENGLRLTRTATLLRTNKRLEDLVLPPEAKKQLAQLCAFVAVRTTVWKDWGFEEKISYGRGMTALFYGASGTGKTLAASIVANELGMPLYRVDLSQLISKYIGETQKNIGQVFDHAKDADCILLFDEADALFARRGDSSDAQDRYANAETAYLLQRTEQYDGIILLATNLLQNLDEAFRRRIDFMIHFSMPDVALREQLWRGIFPAEAPTQGLNLGLLAEQLELTGAGVRNCALTAAYLAAAQHRAIDMGCVAQAAREEYQKQGKSFPARLSIFLPPERRL